MLYNPQQTKCHIPNYLISTCKIHKIKYQFIKYIRKKVEQENIKINQIDIQIGISNLITTVIIKNIEKNLEKIYKDANKYNNMEFINEIRNQLVEIIFDYFTVNNQTNFYIYGGYVRDFILMSNMNDNIKEYFNKYIQSKDKFDIDIYVNSGSIDINKTLETLKLILKYGNLSNHKCYNFEIAKNSYSNGLTFFINNIKFGIDINKSKKLDCDLTCNSLTMDNKKEINLRDNLKIIKDKDKINKIKNEIINLETNYTEETRKIIKLIHVENMSKKNKELKKMNLDDNKFIKLISRISKLLDYGFKIKENEILIPYNGNDMLKDCDCKNNNIYFKKNDIMKLICLECHNIKKIKYEEIVEI